MAKITVLDAIEHALDKSNIKQVKASQIKLLDLIDACDSLMEPTQAELEWVEEEIAYY